jgi:hypothetical protein
MLFVHSKDNMNAEDKKLSAKVSFNWNESQQNQHCARCSWWKEMINGNIMAKVWKNTYK